MIKFAQSELDSAKQKAGYHRNDDTLPLLVYRSAYARRRTSCKQKTYPNPFSYRIGFEYELYGGRYRTRTCDLLHVKQMLYQLS